MGEKEGEGERKGSKMNEGKRRDRWEEGRVAGQRREGRRMG